MLSTVCIKLKLYSRHILYSTTSCHLLLTTSSSSYHLHYSLRPLMLYAYRNNYCIKEISDLKQDLCGKTQYFGDFWDVRAGLCYFKYCSDVCRSGDSTFLFGGNAYTRSTFCCKNKDYCNSAFSSVKGSYSLVLLCISLVIILMNFSWVFLENYFSDLLSTRVCFTFFLSFFILNCVSLCPFVLYDFFPFKHFKLLFFLF